MLLGWVPDEYGLKNPFNFEFGWRLHCRNSFLSAIFQRWRDRRAISKFYLQSPFWESYIVRKKDISRIICRRLYVRSSCVAGNCLVPLNTSKNNKFCLWALPCTDSKHAFWLCSIRAKNLQSNATERPALSLINDHFLNFWVHIPNLTFSMFSRRPRLTHTQPHFRWNLENEKLWNGVQLVGDNL